MSIVKKCERCGIQNNEYVRITATCKKCGKSFLICTTCKLSWKSQKCPSCDAWIGGGTWDFLEMKGSGTVTDDMFSYLEAFSNSTDYIKLWNDGADKRKEEQATDGDSKYRGVELDASEVSFLRNLENILHEPIFTVADDRSNYVIIEDGHVTTLRLRNSHLTDNFPENINVLSKLQELRFERTDRNMPVLQKLPETIVDCKELATVVIRSQSSQINIGILKDLPNLKRLSVHNTFQGSSNDTVAEIFDISTLEELNLRQCTISEQVLEGIGKLTKLRKLNLAWMKTPNSSLNGLPNSLQNCKELEELDIYGTYIGYTYPGQPWPDWITTLPHLKLVHIQHRQLLNKAGPLFGLLEKKYPVIYDVPEVTPEMRRDYSQSDWDRWLDKNKSEELKAGWTGIE
ncbi:MAG: leucine-rich repeat domain-containing protein [Candidatus Thorarchaeota archaeon]